MGTHIHTHTSELVADMPCLWFAFIGFKAIVTRQNQIKPVNKIICANSLQMENYVCNY